MTSLDQPVNPVAELKRLTDNYLKCARTPDSEATFIAMQTSLENLPSNPDCKETYNARRFAEMLIYAL